MSRKYPHAYAAFQRGKGLVGFLAGLVLATMIIIAVLLMLNSNSKSARKTPNLNTPPQQTETLQPNVGSDNTAPTQTDTPSTVASTPNTVGTLDTDMASQTATPPAAVETASDVSGEAASTVFKDDHLKGFEPENVEPNDGNDGMDVKPIDTPPAVNVTPPARPPREPQTPPRGHVDSNGVPNNVKPNREQPKTPAKTSSGNHHTRPNHSGSLKQSDLNIKGVDTPSRKPSTTAPVLTPPKPTPPKVVSNKPPVKTDTKTEPKKTKQSETPKLTPSRPSNEVKPTPQQILDAGNIEKARELARKQATNRQNTPAPAAKRSTSNSGGVVIQAGAYGSRNAAESQRARLALLGVQAKIVEANVNGKATFRVQTSRMEGSQANQTRSLLQRNGVSTLERNAD